MNDKLARFAGKNIASTRSAGRRGYTIDALVCVSKLVLAPPALAVGLAIAAALWGAYMRFDRRHDEYSDRLPPELVQEMEQWLETKGGQK